MDLREIALAKVSRSLAVLAFEGGHAVKGLLTPPRLVKGEGFQTRQRV